MEKVSRIKTTSISHKGGKYGGAGDKTLALLSFKTEADAPDIHLSTCKHIHNHGLPPQSSAPASHLKNVWHRDPRGNMIVFDFVAQHCALEQMVT